MDEETICKYLTQHLTISINQNTEFGPIEEITVTLELEGKTISESSCSLPPPPV